MLTRLTRFLKTVMSPLYSAILPLSTQIEETTDTRRLQILGRNGLVLPSAVVIPILNVMALFSEEILKIWVIILLLPMIVGIIRNPLEIQQLHHILLLLLLLFLFADKFGFAQTAASYLFSTS